MVADIWCGGSADGWKVAMVLDEEARDHSATVGAEQLQMRKHGGVEMHDVREIEVYCRLGGCFVRVMLVVGNKWESTRFDLGNCAHQ